MRTPGEYPIRLARADDADAVARLLREFAVEDDDPTPSVQWLADRTRQLVSDNHAKVLLGAADREPAGIAVLRFRPSLWSDALECHLAELYVTAARRGEGLGRALMEAAIDLARTEGADRMDLSTSEQNSAARALYESLGFSNREGRPERPVQHFYERDL